jgi:transposase
MKMRRIDLNSLGISLKEVRAALHREKRPSIRKRLLAIRAILAGKSVRQAQEIANASRGGVDRWLRHARQGGIQALVRVGRGSCQMGRQETHDPPRPPKVNADPAALREMAAREKNPRVRKRMLALACVAEGMSPLAAAVKTKVAHSAVLARVKRFQKEGIAAFQDKRPFGRPRKLTEAQLQELRLVVLDHPEMTYAQLCDFVRSRFRVRYSIQGLQLLLKRDLAIGWRGRPFRRGCTETKPNNDWSRRRTLARGEVTPIEKS